MRMRRAGICIMHSRRTRRCRRRSSARSAWECGADPVRDIEDRLHAASAGSIEAELVAIALEQTDAEHGALFVWSRDDDGLALVHHVVNGVTVTLPRVVKKDGEKAGIALHVFDGGQPYL